MKKNIVLLLLIVIFSLLLCLCITSYIIVYKYNNIAINSNELDIDIPIPSETAQEIKEYPTQILKDEHLPTSIDNINLLNSPKTEVSEVLFLEESLRILNENGWDGNTDNLPISTFDYSSEFVSTLIKIEETKIESFTIPKEFEELYLSDEAKESIMNYILLSRSEYIEYLTRVGVNEKYIDEINSNAFPSDESRITYVAENNPNSGPSETRALRVGGQVDDYSKLEMSINSLAIYLYASKICSSGLMGNSVDQITIDDHSRCLEMGVRNIVYHEMGHVLQRAVETTNALPGEQKLKSAWNNASKTLLDIDDRKNMSWGEGYFLDLINNRELSMESQADGIAYVVMISKYNMNGEQSELLWKYTIGKLENARDILNKSLIEISSKYTNTSVISLGESLSMKLLDGDQSYKILSKSALKFNRFPAYMGYFNPLTKEEVEEIWIFLND